MKIAKQIKIGGVLLGWMMVLGFMPTNINAQTPTGMIPTDDILNDYYTQLKTEWQDYVLTYREEDNHTNDLDERDKQLIQDIKDKEDVLETLTQYTVKNPSRVSQLRQSQPNITRGLSDEAIDFTGQIGVTVFGDSLVAGSYPVFQQIYPYMNHLGVGSMQIAPEGLSRYQQMINQGVVNQIVVVVLGTNRGLEPDELNQWMTLSGDRQVFFVNTISHVGHRDEVAQEIKSVANRYYNAHEVDFLADYNASYLSSDNIHHTRLGMEAMVRTVIKTMYDTYY